MSVRVAHQTRTGLRPFLRMVSRSSMNKASVPAKAIARVTFHVDAKRLQKERYYILDIDYEAESVLPLLGDSTKMTTLLAQMLRRADVKAKEVESFPLRPQLSMIAPPISL